MPWARLRVWERTPPRLLICAAVLAVLVAWLCIWPHTGDSESAMHYLNLRDAAGDPTKGLSPWARPLYVLVMVVPAMGGLAAARAFSALLTAILAWQTMRLADQLRLANATLAGLLLVCQPLTFALAGDTMTELPMALGIVLAVRLWWARRFAASCLLMGLLPMARPEGFLLAALWGAMALASRPVGPAWRRAATASLPALGTIGWVAACWACMGDPAWLVGNWSWPVDSYEAYGRGPLLYHVYLWPYYCGPVLLVLFVAGLVPSLRREMALPWAVWGIVFGVHSVLFWLGMFAELGLMRIQCTAAPVTALVCLYGWNAIAGRLRRRGVGEGRRRRLGAAALAVAAAVPVGYYVLSAEHHRCFPIRRAAAYVRARGLLETAPRFFAGDPVVLAELGLSPDSPRVMPNHWDRPAQLVALSALPVGAIGIWDNRRAPDWYRVTIEEIRRLGYELLHEERYVVGGFPGTRPWWPPRKVRMRYAVVRMVRPVGVSAEMLEAPGARR